ncbi:MAG: PepSY domain-containing protein [Acidobacteriota bacterium]|nr:PepSY domain-containing protein [Acidobacteriota bacterium]
MTGLTRRFGSGLGVVMASLALMLGGIVATGSVAPASAEAKAAAQATHAAKTAKRMISRSKAINIALGDAKLRRGQVRGLETEIDHEDGKRVYEVEWVKGAYEYEYDIDAYTGKVLDRDVERIGT